MAKSIEDLIAIRRAQTKLLERCDWRGGPASCWPWTGAVNDSPIWVHGKRYTVTRGAWLLEHGKLPKRGLVVRTCGTPSCCNALHMKIGTVRDRVLPGPRAPWRGHEEQIVRLSGPYNVHASIVASTIGITTRDVNACLRHLAGRAKAPSVAAFLKRERRRGL